MEAANSSGRIGRWRTHIRIINPLCEQERLLLKWLFTIVLVVLVMGAFTPWLKRLGYRRIPGDVEIDRNGKRFNFPIVTTIVLSVLASIIFWVLSYSL
jgi:hypothetical protein